MLKLQIELTDNTDINIGLIDNAYWVYSYYKCGTNYKSDRTGKKYAIEVTGLTKKHDNTDIHQRLYIATVWHTKTAIYVYLKLRNESN